MLRMAEVSINDLTSSLDLVFRHLTARETARAGCVCKDWHARVVQNDDPWRKFCSQDFALHEPFSADFKQLATFHKAYAHWSVKAGLEYGTLVGRVCHAYARIRRWLEANAPTVLCRLRPGAEEADLEALESRLGCQLPPALCLLYKVVDGQQIDWMLGLDASDAHDAHGVFGGYKVYNHQPIGHFLPVAYATHLWHYVQSSFAHVAHQGELVPLAWSVTGRKVHMVDCETGLVYINDRVVVPQDVLPGTKDGVVRWIEAYADYLERHAWVQTIPMPSETTTLESKTADIICLFPKRNSPLCSRAVTQGVEVIAAPVYVPEHSQGVYVTELPQGTLQMHVFAYQITFRLLSEAEQAAEHSDVYAFRPRKRVQLQSRHWRILNAHQAVVDEVQGRAVIGEYPILDAGGPEFCYQSLTKQTDSLGYMQGSFRFVEGTFEELTGPQFDVQCARFTLQVPEYAF